MLNVVLWINLSVASTLPESSQQFATFSECPLISGEIIAPCKIGYGTYGKLDDRSNALLVPTWFTGSAAVHAYLGSPELLNPKNILSLLQTHLLMMYQHQHQHRHQTARHSPTESFRR